MHQWSNHFSCSRVNINVDSFVSALFLSSKVPNISFYSSMMCMCRHNFNKSESTIVVVIVQKQSRGKIRAYETVSPGLKMYLSTWIYSLELECTYAGWWAHRYRLPHSNVQSELLFRGEGKYPRRPLSTYDLPRLPLFILVFSVFSLVRSLTAPLPEA